MYEFQNQLLIAHKIIKSHNYYMFEALKQPERLSAFKYRFSTDPTNNRNRRVRRNLFNKEMEAKKKMMSIIIPIKSNFFKATFNPSKFIWVVYHKTILTQQTRKNGKLYSRLKEAFKYLGYTQENLPICSTLLEFANFTKDFQLKVVIDQSIEASVQQYDWIVENENVISVCIIGKIAIDFAKRIRSSMYSSKVHLVEERYDNVISLIARDTERTHSYLQKQAGSNMQNLKNFIFPNFMFLNTQYKAETLAYHNNLLCLINLHNDEVDMQLLRDKFIRECRENELDEASQQLMDFYEYTPLSHKDRLTIYTMQSFFYRYLNNTLRMARSTDQFYLIGEPFNRLFHAVKYYYHFQGLDKKPRSQMKLYRGTRLLEEEFDQLKKSEGQYIEIQGFISTSLDQSVAKQFANYIKIGRKVILEFVFDDLVTTNQDILANDYGYADLSSMSGFENEKEVLINAMNVFKVVSVSRREQIEYITLKYGTILNILSLQGDDIQKLDEKDRIGYYTYKEQMEDRQNYCNIGQINKDTDAHRCVSYYQAKMREYEFTEPKDQQTLKILQHKLAEAYYNNHQPHKAVVFLEKVKAGRDNITKTQDGRNVFSFKKLVRHNSMKVVKDEIGLRKKISSVKVKIDDFSAAEEELQVVGEAVQNLMKEQWNAEIAFRQLQLAFHRTEVIKAIENYLQLKRILIEIERKIDSYIEKLKQSLTNNKTDMLRKALRLKAKAIYQLAAVQNKLDLDDTISYEDLITKFRQNWAELQTITGKKSKQNIYQYHQIYNAAQNRNTNLSEEQASFKESLSKQLNLKETLIDIRVSMNEREQITEEINENYKFVQAMEWNEKELGSQINSIDTMKSQYVIQTLQYGLDHPITLETGVKIAQKSKKMKSFEKAIDILQFQKNQVPYQTMTHHTVLGKSEFMLGMAYLEMGQFGQAHFYFLRALDIYKSLKKPDFQRYGPRFKVQLQLGRTFIFLSSFSKSEQKLNLFEEFAKREKHIHSDVAEVKSQKGLLYMRWGKYNKSKEQIVQSSQMYAFTKGKNSPQYAKSKCNAALVQSKLGSLCDKQKVIRDIEEANAIFNKFYVENSNEKIHCMSYMMKFYHGEIMKKFKEFDVSHKSYQQSIRLQEEYQALKQTKIDAIQKDRDNYEQISYVSHRIVAPKAQMAKKKTHKLTCQAMMIECEIKMNSRIEQIDQKLGILAEAVERQIDEMENSGIIRPVKIVEGYSSTNQQLLRTIRMLKESTSSVVKQKDKKESKNNTKADTTASVQENSLLVQSKARL